MLQGVVDKKALPTLPHNYETRETKNEDTNHKR
jgi:hypothetical protein